MLRYKERDALGTSRDDQWPCVPRIFRTRACSQRCRCPTKAAFKKNCIFFSIVSAMLFSGLLAASSVALVSVLEPEWIKAVCYVKGISWKEDLYEVFVKSTSSEGKYDGTDYYSDSNPDDVRTKKQKELDAVSNKTKVTVPGWLYDVEVRYDDFRFGSAIRDPSDSRLIPPLYDEGNAYECMCIVQKLKTESSMQKDRYEKYLSFFKKWKSEEPAKGPQSKSESESGKGPSFNASRTIVENAGRENVSSAVKHPSPNEPEEEEEEVEEETMYFVVSTSWPAVDTFWESYEVERNVKTTLLLVSVGIFVAAIASLKIYYGHYSQKSLLDSDPYAFRRNHPVLESD